MIPSESAGTMYATKRRRRSVKAAKPPMKDPPKSNPSKRHRLRLNSELDHLASLLPFEQSVISKLDKLSILRLAVSYLRSKSYFQTAIRERYALQGHHRIHHSHHLYAEPSFTDTDCVLQALSGFLFVVTCSGEVFFATRTVEQYLGFHQSDIIHQSALELIHSEDREEFKNQLNWRSQLPQDQQDLTMQQLSLPENSHYLQRCFTVRFRCLLDNTSGFITLEISGRIKTLTGQSLKGEEPSFALFALCCPFGPLPLLDVPPRDYTFKSKHKMDMAPLSMDPRGKLLFGYSDRELLERGGYDLLHPDDLTYYAAAHQELIKTGSSGLIAYRLLTKDFRWIWLQTSSKVIYKNSKPDFVICTHRHLTEDEGRDLVGKRGSEFKLPYPIIDTDPTGLGAALEEEDISKIKSPRNKKSKGQLRDYLQAGRKRKTPYRDVYNGYNGYPTYPSLNGYSACPSDMKTEFIYPYTGQNLAALESTADIYRSGYHPFASTMYPAPTADGFRLDTDKHSYTNGYYLEPRQYQHTLQYHGNGYTDFMSQSSKYGTYDVAKYAGYDHVSSYGLDLTKRARYDEDIARYETDLRKYSDYSSEKLGRVNGTFDSLHSSSLYSGTSNPILQNEGLLSCSSTPQMSTSPCSLYRPGVDRYQNGSLSQEKLVGSPSAPHPVDCKQQMANGQTSVIRNTSPCTKSSPGVEPASVSTSMYQSREGSGVVGSAQAWPGSTATSTPQCKSVHSSDSASGSPLQHIASAVTSRIVSPGHGKADEEGNRGGSEGMGAHNTPSPASATTAISVIQQSGRARSCEKQLSTSGGIAVPVVKSASSWLHLPTPSSSYDWHLPSSDYSSHHQRSLPAASDYNSQQVAAHTRAIVETPKYALLKAGEKAEESNPLLSFSQVTHTLLSSN